MARMSLFVAFPYVIYLFLQKLCWKQNFLPWLPFLLSMCMFEVVFERLKALTGVYPQQLSCMLWSECALRDALCIVLHEPIFGGL